MKNTLFPGFLTAVALAVASFGVSAQAQTEAEPSVGEKVERAGQAAWETTKQGTEKAVDVTQQGAKKAWDATKKGATKAADVTREVGNKIGAEIPGTEQYQATEKP